jgi:hypothetical protein
LASDKDHALLADDFLQTRDDALCLIEAQRRRYLHILWIIHVRGSPPGAQDRDRDASRLIRARLGGNAKPSVSRLSCATVFSPDRSASTSARRAASFSAKRCCGSRSSACTFITRQKGSGCRPGYRHLPPPPQAGRQMAWGPEMWRGVGGWLSSWRGVWGVAWGLRFGVRARRPRHRFLPPPAAHPPRRPTVPESVETARRWRGNRRRASRRGEIPLGELTGALKVFPRQSGEVRQRSSEAAA